MSDFISRQAAIDTGEFEINKEFYKRAVDHDLDGTEGFFTGNVLKYMMRWKKKNGIEDLQKARKYLDWLIEYEGGKA